MLDRSEAYGTVRPIASASRPVSASDWQRMTGYQRCARTAEQAIRPHSHPHCRCIHLLLAQPTRCIAAPRCNT